MESESGLILRGLYDKQGALRLADPAEGSANLIRPKLPFSSTRFLRQLMILFRLQYARRLGAILILASLAGGAAAAPAFVLDGRYHELQQVKLGEDASGAISAWDTLVFLDMGRSANAGIPTEQWLAPPEERDPKVWAGIEEIARQYLAVRALAARAGGHHAPAFQRRALLYPSAVAAWIDTTVRQKLIIDPADIGRYYIATPEKYQAPARAQVRYIFLPVEDLSDSEQSRGAENQLGAIRDRIVKREITFEAAARESSKAPSAEAGGLIPEFQAGSRFQAFEAQTFALSKPGDVSPVFVGNGGVYLIQLVSKTEASKVPIDDVREEIRKRLEHTHIASYYRLLYGRLASTVFTQNFAGIWKYADLGAPIALAGERRLSRDELIRINPSVVNASYEVQWGVVTTESSNWIEGETVLADLEKRGLTNHPLLERAGRIADELLAARELLERSVDRAKVATPQAALAALTGKAADDPAAGIPMGHVIKISAIPDPEALKETGRAEVARLTLRQLGESLSIGMLPAQPSPLPYAERLTSAATQGEDELEKALKAVREAIRGSTFTDIKVRIEDVGWKDTLPGIAWDPALVGRTTGQVSRADEPGGGLNYFLIVGTKISSSSPWLKAPAALQTAAFETEKVHLFLAEVAKFAPKKLAALPEPK